MIYNNTVQKNTLLMNNSQNKVKCLNFGSKSFRSFSFGVDYYGEEWDRKNLSYTPSLTTKKIDEIIKQERNIDVGIQKAYNEISKEHKPIGDFFSSFGTVCKHYDASARSRMYEIKGMVPHGTKIPIIGIFLQLANHDAERLLSPFTGKNGSFFTKRINKRLQEVFNDFNSINEKYNKTNLKKINDNYTEISNHLKEGIEFTNIAIGRNPERDKIHSILKNNLNSFAERKNQTQNMLIHLNDGVIKVLGNTRDKKKQANNIRTFTKLIKGWIQWH